MRASFFGALLLAGCAATPTAKIDAGVTCDPACGAGLACLGGRCGPIACAGGVGCLSGLSCLSGYCADQSCAPPCGAGQACLSQVCVPKIAPPCAIASDCPAGDSCVAGFCSETDCSPACASGEVCLSQVCVPPQGGGCAAPYAACTGYCANLQQDSSNCGGCGVTCGAGEVCNGNGVCAASCVASETLCAGRCADLQSDEENCGACGNACPTGQACSNGACATTCAAPYVTCGVGVTYCADTQNDPSNCGACGTACAAGQVCVAGGCAASCPLPFALCGATCTDTTWDPNNCGGCGMACDGGWCVSGACQGGTPATSSGTTTGTTTGGTTSGTTSGATGATSGATSSTSGFSTLSLVAGGLGGPGNVDGVGAAARFNSPWGVAADDGGDVFVADTGNNTIRKIVVATGAVTTVAGTPGVAGSADDAGAAALFNGPFDVVFDGAGHLFVLDSYSSTVRELTIATGGVTTIAGQAGNCSDADGVGAAAQFCLPTGLIYDGLGNLYVADTHNYIIRQVVVATEAVTTIAGTAGVTGSSDGTGAAAEFNWPQGLALDGLGDLFIVDTHNDTVRQLVLDSGVVTTFAGAAQQAGSTDGTTANARFDEPFGLAWDSAAGELFVSDTNNYTIRSIVPDAGGTGVVSTVAGTLGVGGNLDDAGGEAQFGGVSGMDWDGLGHVYVTDTAANTLRELTVATGAVTTPAGASELCNTTDGIGAAARFNYPTGIVADDGGNLYVADTVSEMIRMLDVATGAVTSLAGSPGGVGPNDGMGAAAQFDNPNAIAWDGTGNLFIADTNNDTIRELDLATGLVTTIAGSAGNVGSSDGTGSAASFNEPAGLVSDGAGHVYIADSENDTFRELTVASGAVVTLAGAHLNAGIGDGIGTTARFDAPRGVAWDGAGHVYVADMLNDAIRQVTVVTLAVITIAGTEGEPGSADGIGTAAQFNLPQGIAWDGAGNLYVADTGNALVRALDVATQAVTTLAGVAGVQKVILGPLPAELNTPIGIAYLPGQGIVFSDSAEDSILEIH